MVKTFKQQFSNFTRSDKKIDLLLVKGLNYDV